MSVLKPEIEMASRSYIKAVQSARLIKMVENAYNNVPFYKKKLDEAGVKPSDIKSIDDIAKLPFTVKDDLRDNYPFGMFAVPQGELVRIHASSGTTGKPTVVGYTKNDIEIWAECTARAIVAAGGTKDDIIHVSYGYGLFTGGLGLHYGAEYIGATALPVSSGNTKRQVQLLIDFGSDILCCTPSYAMFIGETIRDMGIDPKSLKVRAGIFGAEPWTDNMRREIEKLLDIKAYDIYGLSEIAGPGVAYDCVMQDGMHISEDYFYPEVIDPDTLEPLPEGEYGELVFTCIGKEALPLIRYRTRDICALIYEPCKCGRTTIRMTKPKGRSDDMLIIRGINVFPSQVEHVLLELGMNPNYHIVVDRQSNLDVMEVQVEMNADMFSDTVAGLESTKKRIESALQSTLSIHADVKLMEPGSLPRSEGKAKRVTDLRKF
ncbi:MAG TPA: phenylacetate--CoA ligase [Bacillota bacterium]|nr:phenylacetate--CoA ligase [Bacillota bacterium]HOK69303.1 phenylacetate--CoA ligase [Bacillota bacterium]HPP85635.1 phenylacetate--CoA ligase [Bacillota bacterium]